jgi:hypothetical protein
MRWEEEALTLAGPGLRRLQAGVAGQRGSTSCRGGWEVLVDGAVPEGQQPSPGPVSRVRS